MGTQEERFMQALGNIPKVLEVKKLKQEDKHYLLELEKEAEERSLMSLGKVINVAVRAALECDDVYLILNTVEFDWGKKYSTLLMKKEDEIVGEEVRDQDRISQLSQNQDIWFMHKNFAVYKSKISFPQDIMNKICYFEIPPIPAHWEQLAEFWEKGLSVFFAAPSPLGDQFLKDNYFPGPQDQGSGTCLVYTHYLQEPEK